MPTVSHGPIEFTTTWRFGFRQTHLPKYSPSKFIYFIQDVILKQTTPSDTPKRLVAYPTMDTATERQPLLQHHDTLSNSEDPAWARAAPDAEDDPVFSAISLREGLSNAVDFRSLEWPAASVMLVKIQIGLGVLSLPSAMKTLGLIPGTAVLVGCGAMVTLANWISGEFRHANPTVHSVADVAGILGGKVAREVTGVGQA